MRRTGVSDEEKEDVLENKSEDINRKRDVGKIN
jgi:hypothetical protein